MNVLVKGCWAGDQRDIVLQQASQACYVNDSGAILTFSGPSNNKKDFETIIAR